jgi:hypothetical protein
LTFGPETADPAASLHPDTTNGTDHSSISHRQRF